MNKNIIVLNGNIGVGKSTFANILINEHGYKELTFASSLKDILSVLFSWPRHLLEGNTNESRSWRENIDPYLSLEFKEYISPRQMLRKVGKLFREHFHPDTFIFNIYHQLKYDKHSRFVISDCRYENEYMKMKKFNPLFIKIEREEQQQLNLINNNETEKLTDFYVRKIKGEDYNELKNIIFEQCVENIFNILFPFGEDYFTNELGDDKDSIYEYINNGKRPVFLKSKIKHILKTYFHNRIEDIIFYCHNISKIEDENQISITKHSIDYLNDLPNNNIISDNLITNFDFDIIYQNTTIEDMKIFIDNLINQ